MAWGLTNKGSGFRVTMGLTLGPAVRPKLSKAQEEGKENRGRNGGPGALQILAIGPRT